MCEPFGSASAPVCSYAVQTCGCPAKTNKKNRENNYASKNRNRDQMKQSRNARLVLF